MKGSFSEIILINDSHNLFANAECFAWKYIEAYLENLKTTCLVSIFIHENIRKAHGKCSLYASVCFSEPTCAIIPLHLLQ